MPRAEVGSSKYLSNRMKMKGLGRLRWYCQACEKQCRDDNGFACHVNSESHQRTIQAIQPNSHNVIKGYTSQFQSDFLRLLRTAHGTKPVHVNHFYQEYIKDKDHVHMNATSWHSLTEFATHLGREGLCRVEDKEDKGLFIAWIDNSPEALRRHEALRKKEEQAQGEESFEQRLLREQMARSKKEGKLSAAPQEAAKLVQVYQPVEGEKIKLDLFKKATTAAAGPTPPATASASASPLDNSGPPDLASSEESNSQATEDPALVPVAFKIGFKAVAKPKNVFAAKKNVFGGKKIVIKETPKKMSEAERIMKEEMERKRSRDGSGINPGAKRQRQA